MCGKIFEHVLYNSLFNFLNQNDLISPAQSGFKPGDSCINQLLSITHEIYHPWMKFMKFVVYFFKHRKYLYSLSHSALI